MNANAKVTKVQVEFLLTSFYTSISEMQAPNVTHFPSLLVNHHRIDRHLKVCLSYRDPAILRARRES